MHDESHDDDRVIDLDRVAAYGAPPVLGAQWDELHGRWERWDPVAGHWVVVGDETGAPVLPPNERPLPASITHELLDADEEDDRPHIIDVDRIVTPAESVPGAQWNEVVGRWERWDEAAGAWVDALASPHDTTA